MAAELDEVRRHVRAFYKSASRSLPIKKILLYGSWTKGHPREDSDIDVAVVIDDADHTRRVELGAQLFHYTIPIDTRIEPRCIFWDEYLHPEPASILAEILRTGIEIV